MTRTEEPGSATRVARATPHGGARAVTDHEARAALIVTSLLDEEGNPGTSLRDSFIAAATAGLSPADTLRAALDRLTALGFVLVEDDYYRPAPALVLLEHAELGEARALLSGAATEEEDDSARLREEVGMAAELHVMRLCTEELRELGRDDLAAGVVQVSAVSDRYGYDVSAPTIGSLARQLEVKGSTTVSAGLFRFHLTRHEYTVGRSSPETWALVACMVAVEAGSPDQAVARRMEVELLGHCRADTLAPYMPQDGNGRWTEAMVSLPRHLLMSGLPTPVP